MKRRTRIDRKKVAESPPDSRRHPAHQELLDRIAELRADWAAARRPPGSSRRRTADAERAFGLHGKWFAEMLRGKVDMGLDFLFRYLEVLDVTPAELFALAFPTSGSPVDEMARRLRAIAGPRYPALRARYVGGEMRLDDVAYAGIRAAMEPLDNLQKEDPRLAVKAIRAEVEKATETRMRGHWLALLTVAYKGVLRMDEAAACALVALDLAETTGSALLRVDALIAGVPPVVDGDADYSLAAEVMLEALVCAEISGNQDAVGRALLRRGYLPRPRRVDAGGLAPSLASRRAADGNTLEIRRSPSRWRGIGAAR